MTRTTFARAAVLAPLMLGLGGCGQRGSGDHRTGADAPASSDAGRADRPGPADAPANLDGSADAATAAPWRVFSAVNVAAGNLLVNADFARVAGIDAEGWRRFGLGYEIDPGGGRGGSGGLRLASGNAGDVRGASRTVVLGQREARPILVAGWSRAKDVTGEPDGDYSLYVDLQYADGTPGYGYTLDFEVGTHDWQRRDRVLVLSKPVASLTVYCMFRSKHTGTVWFDDLVVRDAGSDLLFDGQLVTAVAAPAPGPMVASVDSGDGVELGFTAGGGLARVAVGGRPVADGGQSHRGGFLVRDVRERSDWVHPGGQLVQQGPDAEHTGELPALGLRFRARYSGRSDRVDVHAELEDTRGTDRAVTLYFALPIDFAGRTWIWGDDIRRARPIAGPIELGNLSREWDIGAAGAISQYPFAAVWTEGAALSLAHGLDQPRVARFVANPATGQLYLAFDLALSPDTKRFPGQAWVDFSIFLGDPAWGFRSAAAGYARRYPRSFQRRLPPEREGTWLPFSRTSRIENPADFGFGVHEINELGEIAADEALGIASFRYLQVPDAYSLWLDGPPAAAFDPQLEARVQAELQAQHAGGTPTQRKQAEGILSSAFHDSSGRLFYRWSPAGEIPWCGGKAGCAMFAVSADPDIADPQYPLNKATADWDQLARGTYQQHPGLDGEFVDGVQAGTYRMMLDQRRSHFVVARQPLTFSAQGHRLGIPSLFATVAFMQWLSAEVHATPGRWLMGNTLLEGLPWAADAFDYLGVETNWIRGGQLVPDSDAAMSYRRTLAGQRPFGILFNTDFAAIGVDNRVERSFQIALFYGIYPSFFSPNAANDPYWDNPALFNRDRPLFRKYIPLIRRLNRDGWQVVTGARSSQPAVHVERFGVWPALFFTLRNTGDQPASTTLTFDAALGLPPGRVVARPLIGGGNELVAGGGAGRPLAVTLGPQQVEMLELGQ